MLLSKFNNWLRSCARLLLTVFVCGMLFIASAYPAQAATSNPTDSEANLNIIQEKSDDVAKANPRGIDEITEEAQKGLNAVQGDADADKMVSPEEADATTVKEKAANFFDNLTN